ncbi:magnesium transporter CorA family protein [Streptosporangium sp. NPDC000396]|uniref:magnesium transporter CorA family protein n=1 Tax=Streptosporangium sp. NPDC000396 TaxID=3366185 RepID=UPI0036B19FB5
MDRTRLYRNGVLKNESFPIDDVSECVDDPAAVVWFDLCSPSHEDLKKIGEELGLHKLAVEDVLNDHQRPKLDIYDSHLFITAYGTRMVSGTLQVTELSIFVTKNALVTVRENENLNLDEVIKRWDDTEHLAKHGVAYLLHGLLDYVVDGQFEVVRELDEKVEGLEDELFADHPSSRREVQRQIFQIRKTMVGFRRVIIGMREVVGSLLHRDVEVVEPEMAPYYQDVYDHVLRVTEWTESLRDLLGNIRETHLNLQGYRLNDIMKKVTSWAAVLAVPTLITGYYGQNVPYPGSGQPIGFWTSTAVILTTSAALYVIFKRKDWL